jgi:hypothetical protein
MVLVLRECKGLASVDDQDRTPPPCTTMFGMRQWLTCCMLGVLLYPLKAPVIPVIGIHKHCADLATNMAAAEALKPCMCMCAIGSILSNA